MASSEPATLAQTTAPSGGTSPKCEDSFANKLPTIEDRLLRMALLMGAPAAAGLMAGDGNRVGRNRVLLLEVKEVGGGVGTLSCSSSSSISSTYKAGSNGGMQHRKCSTTCNARFCRRFFVSVAITSHCCTTSSVILG
jgi:hypothetical protein